MGSHLGGRDAGARQRLRLRRLQRLNGAGRREQGTAQQVRENLLRLRRGSGRRRCCLLLCLPLRLHVSGQYLRV